MTKEQEGKLLRARTKLERVIHGYERHRYLSSWEDEQLRELREARELIHEVVGS